MSDNWVYRPLPKAFVIACRIGMYVSFLLAGATLVAGALSVFGVIPKIGCGK